MPPQLITVENRSSMLGMRDVFNLVWAINYQVRYHFNRSAWVRQGLAPAGRLTRLKPNTKPPAGAWNLILMDTSDQQGALGYHDDETGTGIPYAEVFCKDSIADGATVSSVASHEALEMLVDPDVNSLRTERRRDTDQVYIVEVCDPVQGCDYDVGAPEGRPTKTMVADFCLPAWWTIGGAAGPFSFRNSISAPWEIAPQGYISVAPASSPNDWTQIFGQRQKQLPAWASRLPRIHGRENLNIAVAKEKDEQPVPDELHAGVGAGDRELDRFAAGDAGADH